MLTKRYKYYFALMFLMPCNMIVTGQNGYGPPVFKQDFGIGNSDPATIGSPLPAGSSFFTFENSVCPSPGNYTIVRRVPVANCFNNEWIGLGHDANVYIDFGMMMMVNNNPSATNRIVYMDTVHQALCAGAEYRFSAAIINLDLIDGWGLCPNGADYPVFELRIEDGAGILIKKDTTSPVVSYAVPPSMGYKFAEFGFNFTMPAGVNKLILKLTLLHSVYECAEDFAVDDIQLRPAGPEAVIKFDNEPSTTFVKSVCFQHNSTVSLSGTVGPYYTNTAVQWQQTTDNGATWVDIPGATSFTYSRAFSVADTFLFRLTAGEGLNINNPYCRVVSNTRRVEVDDLPRNYSITVNSPVCSGHDLKFNAEGAASYIWTGPNGFYDNISYPHIFFSSLADSGWYYVDIFSLGGCKTTDSIYATVIGTDVDAGPDTSICKGNSVRLNASTGIRYEWTPSNSLSSASIINPVATPHVTTEYTVKVTDRYGCSDTAKVQIKLVNSVALKAKIDGTDYLCRSYDSASFKDISSGIINKRVWSFDNGRADTTANPPTQYYSITANQNSYVSSLAVTDTAGCTDIAYHILKVAGNCFIAVPSAFTPNGDGLNDFLGPLNAYKATDLLFRVYNRAGQMVFETRDWNRKWNGMIDNARQGTGVYVWILEYTDPAKKRISLKGTTALIR
ncbi:MAG TPA: gliding motility-associated C-terminal domain-containing protein [Chitinophagaceae bacterium]|nr:gliding motility-associated C-terminal domain-containing protein [Chitinophagaceae bacterium]